MTGYSFFILYTKNGLKGVCGGTREHVVNLGMTYSIKKRIGSDLFIERTAALFIGETRIRVVTDEGYQQVGTC